MVKKVKRATLQGKGQAMHPKSAIREPLDSVCTVSEAAQAAKLHPKSILMAILRGYLKYRKTSEGIYLIDSASVIAHWPDRFKDGEETPAGETIPRETEPENL